MQKCVLLINVGTPDKPDAKSVGRYLRRFLGDGRVLTMNSFVRKLLVNLIIVPFRSPKSAKLYQRIWTSEGSPLIVNSEKFRIKIQNRLGDEFAVFSLMRYGNPNLRQFIEKSDDKKYSELIVVPMFPQYASSTTGTVLELIFKELAKKTFIPKIRTIQNFYNKDYFVNAFAENIRKFDINNYDRVLFSFHGLPDSHVETAHNRKSCENYGCKTEINSENRNCYRAQSVETARLIAEKLLLKPDKYTVCFQSRFSKKWLSPFTDKVLIESAKSDEKRILVVSPAFIADCLETVSEIGIEYKELFKQYGGKILDLVPSLNDSDLWVEGLAAEIRGK
jgi:ferrochelatase